MSCKERAAEIKSYGFRQEKLEDYTESEIINEEQTVESIVSSYDEETGRPIKSECEWECLSQCVASYREACKNMNDMFEVQFMRAIHYMDVKLGEQWCADGKADQKFLEEYE